jgi:amidophosphoribosyltransferase
VCSSHSVRPLDPLFPTSLRLGLSLTSLLLGPNRFSNVYGIDMPSPHELVAHNRTTEEVASEIGADLVIFQTLPDLVKSCQQFNPSIETFDCSVFTGKYVTGDITEDYLNSLVVIRNDNAKIKEQGAKGGEVVAEVEEPYNGCSGPMSTSSFPSSRLGS